MKSTMLVRKSAAEALGTFMMVFAGCGSIMIAERFPGSLSPTMVPVIFGLTVATMIYSIGHISGAHFNPAVTLAFAVTRHFPLKEVVAYWIAQFAGALLASVILYFILPIGTEYGTTLSGIASSQALTWEIILTFFLMFVIVSVATDTRAVGTMAGAAIGAAVTIAAFVGGPLTGASMNPARTLAPAVMAGRFEGLWIYFVGPPVGAVVAALSYRWIRCESSENCEPHPTTKTAAKGCC